MYGAWRLSSVHSTDDTNFTILLTLPPEKFRAVSRATSHISDHLHVGVRIEIPVSHSRNIILALQTTMFSLSGYIAEPDGQILQAF
jgi:hypothetical protein